jgi:uncharacterized protein YhbP (UPF0306 family)
MKKIIWQISIILISLCSISISYATTLKITPDTVTVTSNQPFIMKVGIQEVIDLYGAGFDITFDPDLLKVLDITEGDFLKEGTTKTSFLKQIDNEQGRVVIGITRLGSITGVSGSGTLATIVLRPKTPGTTTLKLQNIQLKDSQLDIILADVIDSIINIKLSPVILEILPAEVTILSNQTFTVTITAKNAVDLYGASFDFVFDKDKLKVLKIKEGDFLKQATVSTSFLHKIYNEQGKVVIGTTRLGSITGVSGTGTLATIILKPKASGTTTLKLQNIQLKDSQLDIIPTSVIDSIVNIKLSPVILEILPAEATILSNQTFTVTITAKDAVDMYGASFDFIFDKGKLRVLEVDEGNFLKQATVSTSFLHKIDNEQGKVVIGITRLGSVTGVVGSGTLVSIIMKVKSSGTASLKLTNTLLQDSALDNLEVSSSPTTINISGAGLKITPETTSVLTNQNFTIRVMIDKVVGLYGVSFDILFDSSLLKGIDIKEGNFLNQDGLQTAFLRTIDNKTGRVIIGISRLEKVVGITGSGTLCYVTFKPMSFGTTTLRFDNLYLQDASSDKIDVELNKSEINIIPIRLKFSPQITQVKLNRECEIDIIAEGVVNLFGAGFDIIFDNNLLEVATITEGNFLNRDGKSTHFISYIDNGRIVIGITRSGQVSGISGNGVLCKVIFNSKKPGTTTLSFENIALKSSTLDLLGVVPDTSTIRIVNLKAGPIKGKVTKADRITPIIGANLELIEQDKIIAVTTTETTGEYKFNDLQAGDYKLKVSVPQYNIQFIKQINLAPGEIKTDINFSLPEKIIVYPNPCNVSLGQKAVFFSNIPAKSKIEIYSIAGELISTIDDTTTWNLKNNNNEQIATGIYIYVITNTDGEIIQKGKIGVIK